MCDVWCMLCCGVVVLCCVEVYGVLWCVMWCVPSLSVRAGGVLFKTRTQYQGVLGMKGGGGAPNKGFARRPREFLGCEVGGRM